MKKIKLIYKKCDDPYTTGNEWDYLRDTDWGGQVWSCLYRLDRDATMRANDVDIPLYNINDYAVIYTDDITDEELARLADDGRDYGCLSWNDYEYYTTLGELEDLAGSSVIPCVMDGNNVIIDVAVDDCGRIICEEA